MGWFSDLTDAQGSVIGGLGGAGISSAFGLFAQNQAEKNQAHLLGKSQDFNALQAQLQRTWASQEALTARKWSKKMDNTKVQRRVRDMYKAGINPILAVGGGMSSASPSAPMPSGSAGSVGIANENSVNSGLTAMQSYATMFKSMTSAIADIVRASKDKQTINIKQPASDIADDFKGGTENVLKRVFDKGGDIADYMGIPKKVQNLVASPFTDTSGRTYKASYDRLNTVYKSMQKLRGLPKSSYSKSNFQNVANAILRDRSLKDGQKGILLKRLRSIWSSGK